MSYRRELSLRLNDVLEMVGVTEEMRSYHRRRATMMEILQILYMNRNYGALWGVYLCGSSWEGTVTPDIASDVDYIYCPSEMLVVPHYLMAGPGLFLQAVRDDWTRPGYVKLQLMKDGRPLTVNDEAASEFVGFDGEGRACKRHVTDGTMHGPASMLVDDDGKHFIDRVFAYRCKGIPLFATSWITRHRQYDWPSQELIDELKMMGCLFVSTGHFESRDKELEWRLSFSLQERMMMKSLNIIQHRVYVLLKMTKKNILEKHLNEESLSSYHCKTCVFYMAETTPASMWVPENIISCFLQSLTLLLQWVNDRFCPSFFLNDSNLFDKEGFLRIAVPLERLITSLLQEGHECLYSLYSDRLGKMLRGGDLMLYTPVLNSSINKYILNTDRSSISRIVFTFRRVTEPYYFVPDALSLYLDELEELQNSDWCPGYTEEEYKYALSHALPWLHLIIGLEFATLAVTCPDRHEGKELMEKVDCHLQQARNTDLVNVRLAQATILLRLEKLEECFLWLQELENCWAERLITFCPCTKLGLIVWEDEQQHCEIASECREIPLRRLMRKRYASCVIFERSQIELAPYLLRYEMYRSLHTRSGSRHEEEDAWFDLAALDTKVYLYLLQYMVCLKLNREPNKQAAIDHLASITLSDEYEVLRHRETAYNLLGWVYLQEHRVADALSCFLQSWQIRPHHNAAKFHVLVESYRQAEARTLQQHGTKPSDVSTPVLSDKASPQRRQIQCACQELQTDRGTDMSAK